MNYFLFVSRNFFLFFSFFFILHLFLSPEHEIITLLRTRDQGHIPFIQHLRFYFFIIPLYSLPLISRAQLPLCASSSSSSSSSSFIRLRGLQQRTAHLWSYWFNFSVTHHQYPTLTGLQETCIIRAEETHSLSKVKLYTQPNHQNKCWQWVN